MSRPPQGTVPVVDGFQVIDRTYSEDASFATVGLANIHAVVPGIEENKAKIERAARIFGELGVNVAIFPEFALSGYFWDDEPACRAYMDQALTENHLDWIQEVLVPLCTGDLRAIVLNNLTAGPAGGYRNRTFVVSPLVDDPLSRDSSYDKVLSNLAEIRARDGRVIAICSPRDRRIKTVADHVINVPRTLPEVEPIVNAVPLQLLAYHVADFNGTDVDQPRNLAKSVTVE